MNFHFQTQGINFESYLHQMGRIAFIKLSTIVGEHFESYLHQMARLDMNDRKF